MTDQLDQEKQQQQESEQPQQQTPEQQPEKNESTDKKEIADEEREKMLNAENTKHNAAGELEVEEHKPKRKIPIGAIKMPGFCRSKNKDAKEDSDTKPIDSDAAAAKDAESNAEKANNASKDPKSGFFNNIKLPQLTSVFNRARRNKEPDAELGNTGLTSAEANEDSTEKEKNPDDGMETVRLDVEGPEGDPPKKNLCMLYFDEMRRSPFAFGVVVFVIVTSVIVLSISIFGPRKRFAIPLINGSYIETQTSCGLVLGKVEEGAHVFRGIPYAAPPIGERRWKPAVRLNNLDLCWKGTYNANVTKKCWQRDANGHIDGDEDCLYLDIYSPRTTRENLVSVVVMIGADTLSGPSPGIMQPSGQLARVRETVFVRPNFRLGVFGFLALEAISKNTHPYTSGNYGLSDIIEVLNWVQLNIEHFGGDKDKVTLWGHRAGGTLVTALLGYKPVHRSAPLFQRAWISSGSSIFPSQDLQHAEKHNNDFMIKVECKDLPCLMSKTAEELLDAVPESWLSEDLELPKNEPFAGRHEWLVRDGVYLRNHIGEILAKDTLPVQVVMGSTAQSGASLKLLNSTMTDEEVYKIINSSIIGAKNLTDQAIKIYGSNVTSLATMISDIRVVCPLLTVARMNSTIPFYIDEFPREKFADTDADAAAILGLFPQIHVNQTRHLTVMQQTFNQFVWNGKIKYIDTDHDKRVLLINQDSHPMKDYENCNFWINQTIVPVHGRVD